MSSNTNLTPICRVNSSSFSKWYKAMFYRDQAISLEDKALEVFVFLIKRKNEIITKEELLNSIWVEPKLLTPHVINVCPDQIEQNIDKVLNIYTIETIKRR